VPSTISRPRFVGSLNLSSNTKSTRPAGPPARVRGSLGANLQSNTSTGGAGRRSIWRKHAQSTSPRSTADSCSTDSQHQRHRLHNATRSAELPRGQRGRRQCSN
jgi:hypothetical protein